jgi:hypothetical protein
MKARRLTVSMMSSREALFANASRFICCFEPVG